jgi:hypothetical protein
MVWPLQLLLCVSFRVVPSRFFRKTIQAHINRIQKEQECRDSYPAYEFHEMITISFVILDLSLMWHHNLLS